jgi:predicted MFS family arabinose efflux permease
MSERAIVPLAMAGTGLSLVAFTAPLASLTVTSASLGAGPAAQTWILSSMSLGLAAALLVAGALGDDLGRRRVFVIGAAISVLGAILCAAAAEPVLFVVGRVVEGLGGAAMIACSLGLIGHLIPAGPRRASAAGAWGASVGAGIALGPLLTAGFADVTSWRWAYAVIAILALVIGILASALLPESRAEQPRPVDLVGMLLLAAALVLLLAGLVEGRSGWTKPLTVAELAVAVLLTLAFVVAERRTPTPMLDLRLLRRPAFRAVTIAALVTGLSIIALMSYLSTFLQRGIGSTGLVAGAMLLLWSVTSVVTALGARRLPSRFSGRHQMAASLMLIALGEGLLTLVGSDSGLAIFVPGLVLAGLGSGVLNAALGREAVASVPPDRSGMGSGANNTARYLGSAVGVTIVVAVVATGTGSTPAAALASGWDLAATVAAALSVLGAVLVMLQREPKRSGIETMPAFAVGDAPR